MALDRAVVEYDKTTTDILSKQLLLNIARSHQPLHFTGVSNIADHIKRIDRAIHGMREMLLAAMQVHLTFETVRQNEVVKRLAGWGAILAIPTMVFSWYGMNFRHMPELDWEYSYPAVVGGVTLCSLLLYLRLKKAGWL